MLIRPPRYSGRGADQAAALLPLLAELLVLAAGFAALAGADSFGELVGAGADSLVELAGSLATFPPLRESVR